MRTLAMAALAAGLLAAGGLSVGHLPPLAAGGSGPARDAVVLTPLVPVVVVLTLRRQARERV